jgi:hypothetical protein
MDRRIPLPPEWLCPAPPAWRSWRSQMAEIKGELGGVLDNARQDVTFAADGHNDVFFWFSGRRPLGHFAFVHVSASGQETEIHPEIFPGLGGPGYSALRWPRRGEPPLPVGDSIRIEVRESVAGIAEQTTEAELAEADERSREIAQAAALAVWNRSPRRPLHVQCAGELLGPDQCLSFGGGIPKEWYGERKLRPRIGEWVAEFVKGSRRAFFRGNDQSVPASLFDDGTSSTNGLNTLLRRTDLYCTEVSSLADQKQVSDSIPSSNRAKVDCVRWLTEIMEKSPNSSPKPKADLAAEAQSRFTGISERSFNDEWKTAIDNTGAKWSKPGRRPTKSLQQKSPRQ